MENFTPLSAILGGLLIGAAATLMLWTSGRIAGISGILGGILIPKQADTLWRACFLGGLLLAPLGYIVIGGRELDIDIQASPLLTIVAGLAVGIGTRLGSGCTSGHGICGISRISSRSFVATAVFMCAGIVTVYIARHILGVI
tara:strand:+ start:1484 stop:1912 length:429 start_codon:yes stop_codon:yes gene_type:complete